MKFLFLYEQIFPKITLLEHICFKKIAPCMFNPPHIENFFALGLANFMKLLQKYKKNYFQNPQIPCKCSGFKLNLRTPKNF